jgi:hypothetical protein
MANVIPDLWPDEIAELDVLTPAAILGIQASQLRQKTKGLVEAEVVTETQKDAVHYYFDLIAPALGRYRYRLLDAWHAPRQVYPVFVWTDQWEGPKVPEACASQNGLIELLGRVFKSSDTRAVISSFIAQSNEQRGGAAPAAAQE